VRDLINKRLFSLLLAVIMIAGIPFVSVYAEDADLIEADEPDVIVEDVADSAAVEEAAPSEQEEGSEFILDGDEAFIDENEAVATLDAVDYSKIEAKPYNLKFHFDSGDFGSDNKQTHSHNEKAKSPYSTKCPKPSIGIGAGKDGRGLVANMYNGVYQSEDKKDPDTGEIIQPKESQPVYGSQTTAICNLSEALLYTTKEGNAITSSIDDALYGTNKIGFWTKVEKKDECDRGINPATVRYSFNLLCNRWTENKNNHTWSYSDVSVFAASVQVDNNQEWQYILLDVDPNTDFSSFCGIKLSSSQSGEVFGGNPTILGDQWHSAIYIDEMTFYRGTDAIRTTTLPSNDEEYEYYTNADLQSIYVGDVEAFNSDRNDKNNIILSLPMNFDLNADADKIKVVPKFQDFNGDKNDRTRPIISGATGRVISLPASEDDYGLLAVTAASGRENKYQFRVKYDGLMVAAKGRGMDRLTDGAKMVDITNYSSINNNFTICAVLKDKSTNEMVAFTTVNASVNANATSSIRFQTRGCPRETNNLVMYVYFIDSFGNMNKVANTLVIE
jgi:hypothetical protein